MSGLPSLLRLAKGGRQVILAALLVANIACAHRGEWQSVDYMFSVVGVVKDSVGEPVKGAQVTIELSNTLYEAITPVQRRVLVTDAAGRFIVTLLSHQASNPYSLRFEKGGFVTQTVTGVAPPHQEHAVTLARAPAE
jgi:hypothetical protein